MTDLRTIERDSIRAFVQSAADDGYLSGRVLDYGCGKQPYRDIVEAAGGEYEGYDRAEFGGNVSGEDIGFAGLANWMWGFNAILCTQVLQYVPFETDTDLGDGVRGLLSDMHASFFEYVGDPPRQRTGGGHLVLTYSTNWPEVEPEDLHRFTKAGMERLLTEAGFEIVLHEPRATFRAWVNEWITDEFIVGYGVVARA